MTDDYVPLTDEQVAEIVSYVRAKNVREYLRKFRHAHIGALLADREHYKRRAEAAERVDKCNECHGRGWLIYPNTSTYMHGIGGNAMTKDICEVCWGSGDESRPFRDLREVIQAWGDAERRARLAR